MEKLNKIKPETTNKCITFDIMSVYSNMPLDKTTEKVTDVVYAKTTLKFLQN